MSELACYLQPNDIDFDSSVMQSLSNDIVSQSSIKAPFNIKQYYYQLPLGKLRLLTMTLCLPATTSHTDIEIARKYAIKSALLWHKRCLLSDTSNEAIEDDKAPYYVFALDIQLNATANYLPDTDNYNNKTMQSVAHSFGASYFMEELILEVCDEHNPLQIFSWQDWHTIQAELKTPSELWRFLNFHIAQFQQSSTSGIPSFDSEQVLLTTFINSLCLFTTAIAVDNALVKYAMQDKPNSALVAMSLAQKNNSASAKMYQQHMQQAATLWADLSAQMIETSFEKALAAQVTDNIETNQALQWQQQLLDESLFSRHELVRTLYRHPKQTPALIQSGYVIHQHSYESLGRHYVLIFYGQGANAQQSRAIIQPNLATIAQDVATRLPLAELHHVIVMGIELVKNANDTFIDIDLWIQPTAAMSQKERQLTKQLQLLQKRSKLASSTSKQQPIDSLTKIKLNMTIPARHDK